MTTNLDYETAHQAIQDFKNGKFVDIVAAAQAYNVSIQVVSLMLGNENTITEETFVDEATRQSRLNICNSCDQLLSENNGTCNQCACPISMLVNMEFKSCPLGKW